MIIVQGLPLYIYIYIYGWGAYGEIVIIEGNGHNNMSLGLVIWFNGISTLLGYLMPVYIYIDKIRENGFELMKKRSRRHPAKIITDADYTDDIVLLANTPNRAETSLHSLEWAAAGIGLHVNAHQTEYMCYNQTGHTRRSLSETSRQIHLPRK